MMVQDDIYREARDRFDEINGADSNFIVSNGQKIPAARFYADRLIYWIGRLDPNPSVALLLAAHCQHLKRYEHPRNSYPAGREGYLKWRKDLSKLHAQLSAEILIESAIDEETVAQVRRINLKSEMRSYPDVQTMEDALCLLTLEYQMDNIVATSTEVQLRSILAKIWKKMSDRGRALARTIEHGPEVQAALTAILE